MSARLVSLVLLSAGCVGTIGGEDFGPDAGVTTPDATTPETFTAGTPFDYSLVSPRSQMVATMLSAWSYAASTAPKAIAIDAAGLGYVSIRPGGAEGDADRTALEACYVIGGEKPCTLLARGDVFAIGEHALASSETYSYRMPAPAALADLPFVNASVRSTDVTAYAGRSGTRAIAVSLDGTVLMSNGESVGSQEEADRIMLERCEMQAAMTPCLLFAEGNAPVLGIEAPVFQPRIDFSRTQVATNLPGTTNANYANNIPGYLNALNQGYAGAIAIAPGGEGGMAYNTNAGSVQGSAMSNCSSNLKAGDPPCFLYASGRTITFKATGLAAFRLSAEVHCRAMPRLDCAAHAAIGCGPGMAYTTHTGAVTLEACP